MKIYLQPIDMVWTLANKRLMSVKIDFPLANCSCKHTCDTLKLLNGDIPIPEGECPTALAESNTPPLKL